MEKIFRVGIYLRLSDEDRNKKNKEDDSESIKNQRNLLMEEINKRSNFILVDEYLDEDLSGAGTYRPQFERLIRDCENRKLDVVLCKSQSRFSRDMEIIEKYIHNKFIEWNVRFIGLSDNADTANVGNKKSRQINGLVNEWYLEDVSNNIRSAFNAKMKQGEFISPFAVFGYDVSKEDNNKLIVDPVASLVVRNIFDLYLKGLGFTSIAKYLNNNNIPCPSLYKYQRGIKLNIVSNKTREEIKWSAVAVKTILKNEIYLGHLIQGKRTTVSYKNHKIRNKDKSEWIKVLNTHEAIVDEETFYKVQNLIKKRTKPIKKTGIAHNFSGKVFCLECGHYMRKKSSGKHEYLVCSSNCNGYNYCINRSSIRYDVLENLVLDTINKKIDKFYDEDNLKELILKNFKTKFDEKIKSLEIQKKDIKIKLSKTLEYLKNLYEDKVNGVISYKQFSDLVCIYDDDETVFKNQIKSLEGEIDFYKMKEGELLDSKTFDEYKKFERLNIVIIQEFIDKICIGKLEKDTNTRKIQVKWNF